MRDLLDPTVWVIATVEWNGQRLQAAAMVNKVLCEHDETMMDVVKKDLRRKLAEEIANRMTIRYTVE